MLNSWFEFQAVPKVNAVRPTTKISPGGGVRDRGDNTRLEELSNQNFELKVANEGLEKEKDFYYGKLRDIEVICQETDDNPIIQKILDILYATEVRNHTYTYNTYNISFASVLY